MGLAKTSVTLNGKIIYIETRDKLLGIDGNVGGKTGTAQKVDPETGTYSKDKYISSMIALAPVENPQITVFIAVDEPSNGAYYGW